MNYEKEEDKLENDAVMLIIKPFKVDGIEVSDHFIDYKPGLSRLAIKRHQIIFYTYVIKR